MNYKFPRLTKEEFTFFKEKDKEFFKRFNLQWPLYRRIASALQTLAAAKLVGGYQGIDIVDKKGAIQHHLKARAYDSGIVSRFPIFRKEAGLDE